MIEHEAEIRVEVEELKKQYNFMVEDMHVVGDYIDYIKTSMDTTTANINRDLKQHSENVDQMEKTRKGIEWGMNTCRGMQHAIDDQKDALILYCQQFAFAPEMAPACAKLLNCDATKREYALWSDDERCNVCEGRCYDPAQCLPEGYDYVPEEYVPKEPREEYKKSRKAFELKPELSFREDKPAVFRSAPKKRTPTASRPAIRPRSDYSQRPRSDYSQRPRSDYSQRPRSDYSQRPRSDYGQSRSNYIQPS